MQALETRLADYLGVITGTRPDIRPDAVERASGLPLFLRERYGLRSLRIFGRKCLLALEDERWEPGTPSEYSSHVRALQDALGEPVAIVIARVPAYARNRLVQAGVPFIVPGSQLFLPSMMVDLRERFHSAPVTPGKRLTPAAQCVLLYHLLRESLDGVPLGEIAGKAGYSAMDLSRAKDELEAAALCRAGRRGRSVILEFKAAGADLWQAALPLLSSPARKSHWVDWPDIRHPAIPAGLTALSRRSMIEDDPIPTYALDRETYRHHLENGVLHGSPGPSEANARLEVWSYDPLLLGDKDGVDPLSLILSLRHSADERVQQQLDTLIQEVKWA